MKNIFVVGMMATVSAFASSTAFADQAGDASVAVKFVNQDLTTSGVAGVTGVQTANWNLVSTGATGSATTLNQDVGGLATPLTLSLSWTATAADTAFNTQFGDARPFQNPNANAELLYGGLLSTGTLPADSATITLSGLGATYSNGFSLYIYSSYSGSDNRGGTFTLNGTATRNNLNMDPNTVTNTWVQSTSGSVPGDYLLFTGLSGNSLTINMTGTIANEIQGFEIVAIPEPSTYALLLGGLLVLGCVGRRCHVRH